MYFSRLSLCLYCCSIGAQTVYLGPRCRTLMFSWEIAVTFTGLTEGPTDKPLQKKVWLLQEGIYYTYRNG
jgi:hypothetical protein